MCKKRREKNVSRWNNSFKLINSTFMLKFLCFMAMRRAGILFLNVHVKYFYRALLKNRERRDAFAIKVVHDGKVISSKWTNLNLNSSRLFLMRFNCCCCPECCSRKRTSQIRSQKKQRPDEALTQELCWLN